MHFLHHLLMSSIISLFLFFATRSRSAAIACFLAGLIIDMDHIVECLFLHKKIDFKKIIDNKNHTLYKDKVIISLHSLEIIIIMLAIKINPITVGIAVGMLTHMISDFYYYRKTRQKSLWSLFFLYRFSKGFSVKKLC